MASRTRAPVLAAGLALAAAAAACGPSVSSSVDTESTTAAPRVRRTSEVLTAEEIATVNAVSAYAAVEQLRPAFLRSRGNQSLSGTYYPVVYVNGQRWGELEQLKALQANEIVSIRRLSASEAQSRYGLDHMGGVLDVTTRVGGR